MIRIMKYGQLPDCEIFSRAVPETDVEKTVSDIMVKAEHISKSFGANEVLKDISFTLEKGNVLSIIGPSGSGKSTLIRDVFAKQYKNQVVLVDQSAITATGRSTVCTYLGFFDEIDKGLVPENSILREFIGGKYND